jgi:predicted nucleic acid-binding protein
LSGGGVSEVVLDSTVLIDILRRKPVAIEYVTTLGDTVSCSEISRTEVLRGVRTGDERFAEVLFGRINWVSVDENISRAAGDLGRQWAWGRKDVSAADLIIAATAQVLNAGVATSNVRHFPMFPDLQPPY